MYTLSTYKIVTYIFRHSLVFFQSERGIGGMGRQSARVAFFVTTSGLYVSSGGSDGFTVLAEMFPFRLTFRTETRRFFFDFVDLGLDDVFEGLPKEFLSFCLDSGIGIVQELSERCFFARPLDSTIVIKGLGEELDFPVALSDDGRGGKRGYWLMRHGEARG